jgi:hypothetical protein
MRRPSTLLAAVLLAGRANAGAGVMAWPSSIRRAQGPTVVVRAFRMVREERWARLSSVHSASDRTVDLALKNRAFVRQAWQRIRPFFPEYYGGPEPSTRAAGARTAVGAEWIAGPNYP